MLIAVVALSTACGATLPASPGAPEPPRILATADGRAVTFDELLDVLAERRVVYVGERHDRAADHRAQLAILEGLHARSPSLAVGLEMVQHPFQDAVDGYVRGELDEAALLARIEWEARWNMDFALYRPIFEHARAHGLPIVALNAPAELTRAIARGGLEALDDAQRASLPELVLDDAAHRAMIGAVLREHPGLDETRFERYYAAQVVWDETMAERVARTLSASDGPRQVIVLAGAMHVRPAAIPARAARRGATPHAIVVPVTEDELDEALRADPPVADYLWVTPAP
jgi:uncharacterized iron-regulated protein